MPSVQLASIEGARMFASNLVPDARGSLTALPFGDAASARQFNVVRSNARVLRGMHAHAHYDEYYIPVSGRMFFALKDARLSSSTFGATAGFWVDPGADRAFLVPVGVAHGVYFPDGGALTYGLSANWTGQGEFECLWSDPALGIEWPCAEPVLSERDTHAGRFQDMVAALNAAF